MERFNRGFRQMSKSNYGGALTLKNITKPVLTPLEKYKPYWCPLNHEEWSETCPSCQTLYGQQRRQYDE